MLENLFAAGFHPHKSAVCIEICQAEGEMGEREREWEETLKGNGQKRRWKEKANNCGPKM